jgi:hypothetical protein
MDWTVILKPKTNIQKKKISELTNSNLRYSTVAISYRGKRFAFSSNLAKIDFKVIFW